MDNAPTRPSRPGLADLTRSLHTPLERIAVEHADLVEAVRRHVVADEPVPSGTVPVAAFNSAI
ncbi:FxSxx-COOH cyclophane-containing RiPP peptide [Micromonospora sp. NPDC048986]|uniref:FxSxx-COOH cyclophane-containing RiPP peptide n=1 Tax=Micromonospora sp. NPDC048986 TaxID=3155644 RepID=UPI0034099D2E